MSLNRRNFNPNWASVPGGTIQDILTERGISIADFAKQMGLSEANANRLISGAIRINGRIADQLSKYLGASSGFWEAREKQYRAQLRYLAKQKKRAIKD